MTRAARHPLMESAVERAREAIRRGDTAAALLEVDNILAEAKPLHDMAADVTASLLTFIGTHLGEQAVEAAWRWAAADCWKPVFDVFHRANDVDGFTQAFVAFLHSHRYRFAVIEDGSRWVIDVEWGTTGERMLVEGKVDGMAGDPAGHHHFGVTTDAYPWTFGLTRFPYYDVHSALWMRILPQEWGWPILDVEYGRKAHGMVAETRFVISKRVPE
jgi:hypothetical protein